MVTLSSYFDSKANTWDQQQHESCDLLTIITDLMGNIHGKRILDVGCGTGKLVPYYIKAGAHEILGIDVSSEMIACAQNKFNVWQQREFQSESTSIARPIVSFKNTDLFELIPDTPFDIVVFYNVWPHILQPEDAVSKTASLLTSNGMFVIAHGSSKEAINARHKFVPHEISRELKSAEEECELWSKLFHLEELVDSSDYYFIRGTRKN